MTAEELTRSLRALQKNQTDSKYRFAIEQREKIHQADLDEYKKAAAGLYADTMEQLKGLPQRLAALGLWGGELKTERGIIGHQYHSRLDTLRDKLKEKENALLDYTARQRELWQSDLRQQQIKNRLADMKKSGQGGETANGRGTQREQHRDSDAPVLDSYQKIIDYLYYGKVGDEIKEYSSTGKIRKIPVSASHLR